MKILEEIRKSKKKPKEWVAYLSDAIKKDEKLFSQLIEGLEQGVDVEKGTCADIMKHVTAEKPEYASPYIDTIIKYINYDKAPRVRWGIPESIGNIAQKFPEKVEKAIPNLFLNTKDKSTVIRWCAAFGLTEIAKNNPKAAEKLVPEFEKIIKKEKNNGVKNVYLKALKVISK